MATYGYARVSHVSPSLDVQIKALKAAGCSVIRAEKKSGTSLQDRTELKTLLDFVRQGDILCVPASTGSRVPLPTSLTSSASLRPRACR